MNKKPKQRRAASTIRKTAHLKRKLNRSETKQSNTKSRQKILSTGLNGAYWNVIPADRCRNRSALNRDHLDENDVDDSTSESEATLIFSKKIFLTCRSPTNSFFICQTLQNVYSNTKQIRIQWYSFADENQDESKIDENTHFKLSYQDKLDVDTILTGISNVVVHPDKTITLNKQDVIVTKRLLRNSIKVDSTNDIKITKTRKRIVVSTGDAAPIRKRRRTKDINEMINITNDNVESKHKPKDNTTKCTRIPRAKLFKVQSNRFLIENSNVTVYQVDPFFEDNVPVPFISSSVQSKLAIRAVLLNDTELLKSLINDLDHVYSVHIKRNIFSNLSAIHYAIKTDNVEILKILLENLHQPLHDRCPYPKMIKPEQTKENASKGRKSLEGNDALFKDTENSLNYSDRADIVLYALRENCSCEVYDLIRKMLRGLLSHDAIAACIAAGHRQLMANIIKNIKLSYYGFNEVHCQVLSSNEEDLTIKSAVNAIKKLKKTGITPIHCAAINPNPKYLKQLLAIVAEYNIMDKKGAQPIHYAAACEGTEPLEYLLSKDVKFNETNKAGNTPLHVAVLYGRYRNAEILLRKAKEKAESNEPDNQIEHEKYGLASINRMNKNRCYPLHIAVRHKHLACVNILIQYGACIDALTSISRKKLTPLMFACRVGALEIVKVLIAHGARVEARDSFKRTPLIHASICGCAHIVSYLLRKGANPNVCDSSMNTALHYAVAYGWYFCVRLLMEAGANLNSVNCCQVTCLSIGFLKGHYGICDYLLTEHQADINFKTAEGLTIVMLIINLGISKSAMQQIEFTVVKHKADCTCVDINGSNAFHHLAMTSTTGKSNESSKKEELRDYCFRMAQILLDYHCNPSQMNNKAQTPLMLGLESKNFDMVDFLINRAKVEVTLDISRNAKTLLHYFAMNSDDERFVQILLNLPATNELKAMVQMFDDQGLTPFHHCAMRYAELFSDRYYVRETMVKQYKSIIKMIRYCLEILECDPDLPIKDLTNQTSKSNETTLYSITEETVRETSIFLLLHEGLYTTQADEHPLEIILQKSKNINIVRPQTGRTPLLQAIHTKNNKIICLLLQQPSCDVNLAVSKETSERGQTPLMVACKLQYFPAIRNLLNHPKCDLLLRDDQHNQALHYYLATSTRSDEYLEIFHLFINKLISISKHTLNSQGKAGSTPLHVAVYYNAGAIDTANIIEQTLVDNDCDLFIKDDVGNMPLHNVFLGNKDSADPVELCTLIMQGMKYELLDTRNNEGNTPLHLAVMKSATVCTLFLLQHYSILRSEDSLSNSLIGTCIQAKHMNLLITFLQQPIKIDLSKSYMKPTSIRSSEDIKMCKMWTWHFAPKPKATSIEENSLISLIIAQQNWHGLLSLIFSDLDRFHLKYIDILEPAILHSQYNLVLRRLSTIRDGTVLHEKNSSGRNLFHILALTQTSDACFVNKCLTYLDEYNVDWKVADKYGMYPLHYACVLHNKLLIEFLQKKYSSELDLYQIDGYGNTAYGLLFWHEAMKSSIEKIFLKTLITSNKAVDCLCNYDNSIAREPLSFGFMNSTAVNIIAQTPIESRNASNTIRTSPLIHAILYNNVELVKFLLELGADVNLADEEKLTPLMHAIRQNNISLVKLLLNKNYTTDENQQSSQRKSDISSRKSMMSNTNQKDNEEKQENIEDNPDDTERMDDSNTFELTSQIDFNATDTLGRTCIHHLVQSLTDASYTNNVELLELLHVSGASLTKPDQMGRSPLQYCAMNSACQHLYNRLRVLTNEQFIDTAANCINQRFIVNDPNKSLLGLSNYYSDAEEYINQYIASHQSDKTNIIYQVDPVSEMTKTGEIVIDLPSNEPYDVRLTITDIDYGLISLYNFYRMQIIKHKTKTKLYLLFTRWGRIGDGDGQHQLTPYSSFHECQAEFCKIFNEKTGNMWENKNQFDKKPGKYTLIQLDKRRTHKYTNVPIDFQQLEDENQQISSKLESSAYKSFFKTFLNSQAIRENIRNSDLDVEWMPISQLSPESLKRARDILVKLKSNIEKKDTLKLIIQQNAATEWKDVSSKSEIQTTTDPDEKNEFKLLLDSICQLNNEYYSIVPSLNYGKEKLPMIDTLHAVKMQERKLDDIVEIELSYKILLAAQANLNRISPLDYLYKSINYQFEAMNQNDIESQYILRYIWASVPNTKVEQIFKIARNNVNEQLFKQNIDNHCLLWHGTNICNLISILTRGLLVRPLYAKNTGCLFGKGIYTSDAFIKSLSYCSGITEKDGARCFMLLCEVAMGNYEEIKENNDDQAKPLNTNIFHSRKAHGDLTPDPRHTITLNYGPQMPLGRLTSCENPRHSSHPWSYNEYIVFDESQIVIRYIVQFRR